MYLEFLKMFLFGNLNISKIYDLSAGIGIWQMPSLIDPLCLSILIYFMCKAFVIFYTLVNLFLFSQFRILRTRIINKRIVMH